MRSTPSASRKRTSSVPLDAHDNDTYNGKAQPPEAPAGAREAGPCPRAKSQTNKLVLFAVVAVAWLVFDFATKAAARAHDAGTVFAGPFAGLVQFKLVHNTGAAWSMFSDSTALLGAFGIAVVIVIGIAVARFAARLTWVEAAALGLVLAGGLGNAIDRFTLGYVVDFIQTLFVSFPVFNVADIGVTCGIVIFAVSVVLRMGSDRSADAPFATPTDEPAAQQSDAGAPAASSQSSNDASPEQKGPSDHAS